MRRLLAMIPLAAILVLAAAAVAQATGFASAADPSMRDLEGVRQRLVETLLPPGGPPAISEKEALQSMRMLLPDGRWPDIDYASQQRSNWLPGGHPRRALQLAQCYRAPGHPLSGKADVRDKINLALRWWIASDLECPNWWWNRIGVPEALARAILLLGDEFPADLLPGAARILRRADNDDMTGQNTLWVCTVRAMRGCIEKSPEVVAAAFKRIADEVKITAGEGVQPDFSFHQHGPLLYSGGYGRGFAAYGPEFARLAAGTAWAFPPEKIGILSSYLLDGEQWMIRGDRFDPSCIGREITRKSHTAAPLAKACGDMIALGAPRRAEFEAFARRLRGEKDAPALAGNRHFWRSDFMVHQRPDWYASVRMFSNRLYNSELVNGEGKKSHHLADGLTLIMRTGREFDGVPPVWDWKRLPGTTCEQGPLPDPVKQKGETSFVGGVSDGTYGVAAMDLRRGPLTAKKAWFFFDDCVMALGAGITCTSDSRVLTSIDQRPLKGDVVVPDAAGLRVVARGSPGRPATPWVWHDGFAYVLSEAPGACLKTDTQTGSWREISDPASAEKVSMDVFSLWLDHGRQPAGQAYAYAVRRAAKPEDVRTLGLEAPEEVAKNTVEAQAVQCRARGFTGIVFWKPGTVVMDRATLVSADKPCLLLFHHMTDRVLLAVANPQNQPLNVTVEITAKLDGEGCTWSAETKRTGIVFNLPGGAEAGKSIVRELKVRKP